MKNESVALWSDLYMGKAPWLADGIKSLQLPASLASELARLVTIEMESRISGSARADFLDAQYQPVVAALRRHVEYACAKGGLIFKPYVENGRIAVDFIQIGRAHV